MYVLALLITVAYLQPLSPSCTDRTQEAGIFRRHGEAEEALQDDRLFTRTRKYTDVTRLLRLLHDGLVRTIESWEEFEVGELGYFENDESAKSRELWRKYLSDVEVDLKELRSFRRILQQRIEFFDSMRNGVRLSSPARVRSLRFAPTSSAGECVRNGRKSSRDRSR